MTAFFKPKPKVPEPEMIYWTTTKPVPGTTALEKANAAMDDMDRRGELS